MFSARRHVRSLIPVSPPSIVVKNPWGRRSLSCTCGRWAKTPKKLSKTVLHSSYPLAEQLLATGIWKLPHYNTAQNANEESRTSQEHEEDVGEGEDQAAAAPSKSKKAGASTKKSKEKKPKVTGDKTRVNIVNEKLCDQIIKYIGHTLERHKGCDLIDIYPGAGLWSQKLNKFLEPRSHILMEPDENLYRPFLEPILRKPGSILVPKSGIVWRELNSVLTPEYLPHQKPIEAGTTNPPRNDTLLVTANIAFHPKKRFKSFDSIALLVYHQLLSSIRTSTLFQQYGQVRMLIWSRPEDMSSLLPRYMQRRRRGAIDGELLCEWVREVCGRDLLGNYWYVRDTATEVHSSLRTRQRMREHRMRVPAERATEGMIEAKFSRKKPPGKAPPEFKRPFNDTLLQLETKHKKQVFTTDSGEFKSMKAYQWRWSAEKKRYEKMHNMMTDVDTITALYKAGNAESTPTERARLIAEWHDKMRHERGGFVQEFTTYRDNLHYVRQDPPVLHWDRRAYEPLTVRADEFLPNIECTLVDIQPRDDVHPLLRQAGPQSNRAADTLDMIMGTLLAHSTMAVPHLLDAVWPGAAEFIMPRWTSIRDLERGEGVPDMYGNDAAAAAASAAAAAGEPSAGPARHTSYNHRHQYLEITPRMLNARQWEQLIELWMQWPFRPELHELIARTQDIDDSNSSTGSEGAEGFGAAD